MAQVGEIKTRSECGFKGINKVIWHACIDCGKERWVSLIGGEPESLRCHSCAELGERHWNWKGGQHLDTKGYMQIYKPEHPKADSNGYIKRAILVLEEKLGRHLLPNMDSHHKNDIKDDDRPENLEELPKAKHLSLHNKQAGGNIRWNSRH